jgi:hypothetical protein
MICQPAAFRAQQLSHDAWIKVYDATAGAALHKRTSVRYQNEMA